MWASLLTIAWGTFAFGAVYSWAYVPLAAACVVVGGLGCISGRGRLRDTWLFASLAAMLVVGLVQLVPIPQSIIAALSPATDRFLRTYDLTYAVGVSQSLDTAGTVYHPLSIAPAATMRAVGLLAAFAVLLVGLLRTMTPEMALRLGRGLALLGGVVALVGVVQKALLGDHAFAGMKIYGLWAPEYALATPFGPFVNKNHFAGWMLMVLPLAFGLVMGALEQHADAMGRGFRRRLLWLSRPEGGQVLLLVFGALLMALSLVMTRSRSGLACLLLITIVGGVLAVRRPGARRKGPVLLLSLALFLVVVVAWAGADTAVSRFANDSDSVQLRLRIWRLAARIVGDFPVLGTGLDTFGVSMIVYQEPGGSLHYQEAHNDYLQLLSEGGFVLLGLIGVAIVSLVRGIRDRFRTPESRPDLYWLRVGATIGLIAIALQSGVEFSLQMPGNAVLFTVLVALALYSSPPPAPADGPAPDGWITLTAKVAPYR